MAYKHRDIVIAWMDGETIQFKNGHGEWVDHRPFESLLYYPAIGLPSETIEYRIKPKPVMIRHARLCAEACTMLVYAKNYNEQEDRVSKEAEQDTRIVWLDEWHEASFTASKED